MIKIIKKDGTSEDFDKNKIIRAINQSSKRVMIKLQESDINGVINIVENYLNSKSISKIEVLKLHNIVEMALEKVNPLVAKSYREYRNYKADFVGMLDEVYQKAQSIMYLGDKENSNTDSSLVATKRSLIYNELNKELYNKFFLTTEEKQACRDGYIYINDKSARRDTVNCCLYDVETVLTGGFEMGNIWYNEPKTLDVAFDVIGDIVMASASQQYGGWTCSQVDRILGKYAKLSYEKHIQDILDDIKSVSDIKDISINNAESLAWKKLVREMEQGVQGWEMKFNTVGSSRGDYPFLTVSGGLCRDKFEKLAWETILKVRMEGQGKKGFKKPVLFPKLVFIYDENLHDEGNPLEDLFEVGVQCSSKTMYPDFLSMTGDSYVSDIYKQYGEVISPMG